MNFGMIILNQSIKTKKNYVTLILTALLFILKLTIFTKILLMILKNVQFKTDSFYKDITNGFENGFTHLTIMIMKKGHFQWAKTKK